MSRIPAWSRRGEWLELMPGKLSPAEGQDRVDAALVWLSDHLNAPPKLIRRLLAEGGVKLAGDRLRLHLFSPRTSSYAPLLTAELNLLFEDDWCLVVHKPVGLKVHPDGTGIAASHLQGGLTAMTPPNTLANQVSGLFASRKEAVAAAHIHRLDECTSGPVLFAKNEYAQLKLDEAMSRKAIHRTYIAFVQGQVSPELKIIDLPIGRDRHHNQRRRVSLGGKSAITHVELLEVFPQHDLSLVRLTLETGRTHQIRVHLSHAGHPLVGDTLYGGGTKWLSHQALHGERLAFLHPLTGERVEVADPWPVELTQLYERIR
ncbi:RluA family pseudouridine synthase [Paenibacillus senegalimassiliensis]|uniref:RluA family pseudouridine synthase n=1 Tax=Paenibacillus senegalimassiliensis TaxID=1737426 RepID=UPI001E48B6B8|nr:RluA family pseudouridine synthase [Paenibacillus senegalimassiliensis]